MQVNDEIDLSNQGCMALNQGNFKLAEQSYSKCLKLRLENGNLSSIAVASGGLADAYLY